MPIQQMMLGGGGAMEVVDLASWAGLSKTQTTKVTVKHYEELVCEQDEPDNGWTGIPAGKQFFMSLFGYITTNLTNSVWHEGNSTYSMPSNITLPDSVTTTGTWQSSYNPSDLANPSTSLNNTSGNKGAYSDNNDSDDGLSLIFTFNSGLGSGLGFTYAAWNRRTEMTNHRAVALEITISNSNGSTGNTAFFIPKGDLRTTIVGTSNSNGRSGYTFYPTTKTARSDITGISGNSAPSTFFVY